MASGTINMTSTAKDFEGRILYTTKTNLSLNTTDITLTYQVHRVGLEGTIGGNSSSYSLWATINSKNTVVNSGVTYTTSVLHVDNDGTWTTIYTSGHTIVHSADGTAAMTITARMNGITNGVYFNVENAEIPIEPAVKIATLTSAPNFKDSDNPTIKYTNPMGERVTTLEVCIANSTGYTVIVPYRSISKTGISYTFNLTTAERNKLIAAAGNSTSIKVRFYIRTTVDGVTIDNPLDYAPRTFTIEAGGPTITASIEDVQTKTATLTGGGLKFIRGNNSMQFSMTATGQKGATISKYSVMCGSRTINSSSGTFTNIENNVVIFSATDNRGKTSTKTIELEAVDYIKLTCNQEVKMILESEDSAQMSLKIDGNYFNSSFGAKNNTLTIYTRHRRNNEDYSEWGDITPLLASNTGGRYTLSANMSGFDPSGTYTFQCKAVDALGEAVTSEYAVQFMPIFDWSKNDFNFNVPISIEGHPLADYVIEEGVEAMGTNGTWYWRKWRSGRADCYGCRNYGNMAVTTTWGGLYRSGAFTQSLPSGLFVAAPEVIDITFRGGSNVGGWIANHENSAPTSSETGSFILVRPASATLTGSYISFNVIGRWK